MPTSFRTAYLEYAQAGLEPNWREICEFLRGELSGDISSVMLVHRTGAPEVLAEAGAETPQISYYRSANTSGATASDANPYFAQAMKSRSNEARAFISSADALLPFDDVKKSQFFKEHMAPAGVNDAVGGLFFDKTLLLGKISILRSSGRARYGAQEAEKLVSIDDLLVSGLLRSRAIREIRFRRVAGDAELQRASAGIVIFDLRGGLLETAGIDAEAAQRHADRLAPGVRKFVLETGGDSVRHPAPHRAFRMSGQTTTGKDGSTVDYCFERILLNGRPRVLCLIEFAPRGTAAAPIHLPANMRFTPREMDVLRLLIRGIDNASIATSLGIGIYTVKDHLKSIFNKINVRTRAAAVAYLTRGVRFNTQPQ